MPLPLTDPTDWLASQQQGPPTKQQAPGGMTPPLTDPTEWLKGQAPGPQTPLLIHPGGKAPAVPKSDINFGDSAKAIGDYAMSALPYAGAATAVGLGPAGAIPAVLMAGLGGAAGGAIEQGGRAATGIDAPESIADAGKKIGEAGLEQGATELGGRAIGWAAGRTIGKYLNARKLYQSALKPAGTEPITPMRTVDTGIREGIKLNDAALPEIQSRISDLSNQVNDIIRTNPQDIPAGNYIANIQGRFDKLRAKWGRSGTKGTQYLEQIDNAERAFLLREGKIQPLTQQVPTQITSPIAGANGQPITRTVMKTVTTQPEDMTLAQLRQGAQDIPAMEGQRIKQATYEALRVPKTSSAYAPNIHPALAIRLEKGLAGSMMEELGNLYPEVIAPNQRTGELMDLKKAVGAFVKREGNKQITPYFIAPAFGMAMGSHFGGAEGAGLGGAAGMVGAHLTRQMMEDPAVKSALAIILNRGGRMADRLTANAPMRLAVKATTRGNVARGVEAEGKHYLFGKRDEPQTGDQQAGDPNDPLGLKKYVDIPQ